MIWGNDSTYIFDSNSKDENGNLSSSGTAVLLKFDSLYSLENYIQSVWYNAYPWTLYFQVQFIKVHCTVNAKNAIKCSLKKERLLANRRRDLDGKKIKYQDDPEKKRQAVKKRYSDKKESIKQYKKEQYVEHQTSNASHKKAKC